MIVHIHYKWYLRNTVIVVVVVNCNIFLLTFPEHVDTTASDIRPNNPVSQRSNGLLWCSNRGGRNEAESEQENWEEN